MRSVSTSAIMFASSSILAMSYPAAALAQPVEQQSAEQPGEPSESTSADTAAGSDGGSGEIVITAQKRSQSLQDVPLTVTAMSAERIQELGIKDTTDIIAQVPGVKMLQFGPSFTNLGIRGVSQNDFADHLEAPIAVYSDDAYISAPGAVGGRMFDVERVEILRGPQGTLFGRNATGGVIHYISKKPTDFVEGYAEVTALTFGSVTAEGAVGGPLAGGVSGRISGTVTRQDGWIKNRVGPDIMRAKSYALRGQLKFEPTEDLSLLLKGHYASDSGTQAAGYVWGAAFPGPDGLGIPVPDDVDLWGTCPGCDLVGYKEPDDDVTTGSWDFNGGFDREVYGATANLEWDGPGFTVTAITDLLRLDKQFSDDMDATPIALANYTTDQYLKQFSQELRVSGTTPTLNWIFGLYYLNIDGDQEATVPLPLFGLLSEARWNLRSKSYSAFAQAGWEFQPGWTLTAGARYTHDIRTMDFVLQDNTGNLLRFNRETYPDLARKTFSNVSAKLGIDWKPSDNTMIYASVTRGTKAGNFAAPVLFPVNPEVLPHDQEVLTSYEAGFKLTALDRAVRLNGAVFYYDYKDYQAFFLQNNVQSISNTDAWVKGAELELNLNPVAGLTGSLGVSILDTKVEDVRLPSGRIVDRELPLAPNFSFNGLVRYEWGTPIGEMAVQSDFLYNGPMNFSVTAAPVEQEDSYFVANARVALKPTDRLEVAAFVRNVTDTKYRAYGLDISALGFVGNRYAPPRWFGGSISYRW